VPISARNASTIEIDAVNREVRAPVRNWVPANVNAGPVGVAFLISFEAVAGAIVCALIAAATWFIIKRQ
jgi:hypothetical protein